MQPAVLLPVAATTSMLLILVDSQLTPLPSRCLPHSY